MKKTVFHERLLELGFKYYGPSLLKEADLYQLRVSENHYINVFDYGLPANLNTLILAGDEGRTIDTSEIEIYFLTKDGDSCTARYYGIAKEKLLEKIHRYIKRLIDSIEVLGGNPKS